MPPVQHVRVCQSKLGKLAVKIHKTLELGVLRSARLFGGRRVRYEPIFWAANGLVGALRFREQRISHLGVDDDGLDGHLVQLLDS